MLLPYFMLLDSSNATCHFASADPAILEGFRSMWAVLSRCGAVIAMLSRPATPARSKP